MNFECNCGTIGCAHCNYSNYLQTSIITNDCEPSFKKEPNRRSSKKNRIDYSYDDLDDRKQLETNAIPLIVSLTFNFIFIIIIISLIASK